MGSCLRPLKHWERRSYDTVPKYKDVCQLYLFIANLFILHVFHLFVVDRGRAWMRKRKSRDKDFDFLLFSLPIIPCSCHHARHVRRLGVTQSVKYCEQAQWDATQLIFIRRLMKLICEDSRRFLLETACRTLRLRESRLSQIYKVIIRVCVVSFISGEWESTPFNIWTTERKSDAECLTVPTSSF